MPSYRQTWAYRHRTPVAARKLVNEMRVHTLRDSAAKQIRKDHHTKVKGLITNFFAHLELSFEVVTNDSSDVRGIYNYCVHDHYWVILWQAQRKKLSCENNFTLPYTNHSPFYLWFHTVIIFDKIMATLAIIVVAFSLRNKNFSAFMLWNNFWLCL